MKKHLMRSIVFGLMIITILCACPYSFAAAVETSESIRTKSTIGPYMIKYMWDQKADNVEGCDVYLSPDGTGGYPKSFSMTYELGSRVKDKTIVWSVRYEGKTVSQEVSGFQITHDPEKRRVTLTAVSPCDTSGKLTYDKSVGAEYFRHVFYLRAECFDENGKKIDFKRPADYVPDESDPTGAPEFYNFSNGYVPASQVTFKENIFRQGYKFSFRGIYAKKGETIDLTLVSVKPKNATNLNEFVIVSGAEYATGEPADRERLSKLRQENTRYIDIIKIDDAHYQIKCKEKGTFGIGYLYNKNDGTDGYAWLIATLEILDEVPEVTLKTAKYADTKPQLIQNNSSGELSSHEVRLSLDQSAENVEYYDGLRVYLSADRSCGLPKEFTFSYELGYALKPEDLHWKLTQENTDETENCGYKIKHDPEKQQFIITALHQPLTSQPHYETVASVFRDFYKRGLLFEIYYVNKLQMEVTLASFSLYDFVGDYIPSGKIRFDESVWVSDSEDKGYRVYVKKGETVDLTLVSSLPKAVTDLPSIDVLSMCVNQKTETVWITAINREEQEWEKYVDVVKVDDEHWKITGKELGNVSISIPHSDKLVTIMVVDEIPETVWETKQETVLQSGFETQQTLIQVNENEEPQAAPDFAPGKDQINVQKGSSNQAVLQKIVWWMLPAIFAIGGVISVSYVIIKRKKEH